MKNVFGLFLLAAFLMVGSAFTTADDFIAYNVDTVESIIYWKGYKVTGQHDGTVNIKSGALEYDGGELVGGNFTIDMGSITVKDLEGEYKTKLENHLKSEDFFGVEKFPSAQFVITKVMSRGMPGDYRIEGNLTIKETTKPIKFNASVKQEGSKRVATADITIDRAEYNVRYGSGSFFDNLGDKTIYDEFDLTVNLVANVQ